MDAREIATLIIPFPHYDFQWSSPYPLEECGVRLEQCSQRDNWFAQRDRLRVIVSLEGCGVLRFALDVDAAAGNRVDVQGYLASQPNGMTLVVGAAFIRPLTPGMGWLVLGTKFQIVQLIRRTLVPPNPKLKLNWKKAA